MNHIPCKRLVRRGDPLTAPRPASGAGRCGADVLQFDPVCHRSAPRGWRRDHDDRAAEGPVTELQIEMQAIRPPIGVARADVALHHARQSTPLELRLVQRCLRLLTEPNMHIPRLPDCARWPGCGPRGPPSRSPPPRGPCHLGRRPPPSTAESRGRGSAGYAPGLHRIHRPNRGPPVPLP